MPFSHRDQWSTAHVKTQLVARSRGSGLAAARLRAHVEHQLPTLKRRKETEGRHPTACVPARDLPEQFAIGLPLYARRGKAWSVRRTLGVVSVAGATPLVKQLPAASSSLRIVGEWVGSRRFSRWCNPSRLMFTRIRRLPSAQDYRPNQDGRRQYDHRSHRCLHAGNS
jgi:hypothetical protein